MIWGLTTPVITGIVSNLLADHVVREVDEPDLVEAKGAGRRRVMLEFNPDRYYICGVDLSPYHTNYVLTDLQGHTLARRQTFGRWMSTAKPWNSWSSRFRIFGKNAKFRGRSCWAWVLPCLD